MLKVNGYERNYNNLFIYNDNCEILFQTERPYDLDIDFTTNIRNARKLILNKKDCFEIKANKNSDYLFRNGKDLYIHNSVIDVVNVEEKQVFEAHGETCYKDVYTLRLQDGTEVEVESDFFTRTEKTNDRLYREKLAEIISECMYGGNYISHYGVEKLLEKLDIIIKE